MIIRAAWLAGALLVGCGGASHRSDGGEPARDGGVPRRDGGAVGRDAGGVRRDAGGIVLRDAGPPMPRPPALCGGAECVAGEACCTERGVCYDPARPDDCALVMPPPPESGSGVVCASDADCAAGEFCRVPGGSCVGAGWCFPRAHPGISCGEGPGACGCDGRSYATICEAYEAGTSVSYAGMRGSCGSSSSPAVVICGRDSDCPSGRTCCSRTGICVASGCAECCAPAPSGTLASCADDDGCIFLSDRGVPGDFYCFGTGCGETGGGCVYPNRDRCTGEFAPVCGCDGVTYSNACWAQVARTRIAHEGECE